MGLGQRLKKIRIFISQYSISNLINLFASFAENLAESSLSGGNILVKLIYILSLFGLNTLLRILTLVKWLLTNASQFIQEIVKLLRFLLALSVEEANFYWQNIKNSGKRLLLELEEIIQKMSKETQTLQQNIANDGYHKSDADPPPVSNLNVVLVIFALLGWVLFFL